MRAEFPTVVTTARLLLQRWEPVRDDAAFAEFNAQPEVMRFLNDGVPAPVMKTAGRIDEEDCAFRIGQFMDTFWIHY